MHHTNFPGLAALVLTSACIANLSRADDASPSFRNDVMAVLSKSGCNQGTCHGNANGKGGLKLSLRGQNPESDYITLSRESAARRVTPLSPADSLLLQKPSMQIPHEGGRRFPPGSSEYKILQNWIANGLPKDDDTSAIVVSLKVTPSQKTLHFPENSVSLLATATFSDGSTRDVTSLTVFGSSATFVSITDTGVATADQPGLTTIVARYLNQQVPVRLEFVPERPDFEFKTPKATNFIDEAVFAQLKRLKTNPADVCDDSTFLRRVYLDLTGLLPTIEQAKAFIESPEPNKRSKLIDTLLASEEFNDFQTLRWADLLRVEEKTLDATGVEVYHNWIRTSVAEDKPLNTFVAELIAARGSTYKVPPTNFFRALRTPEERSEAAAQVFLGIRLQCAKCHNHPFDRWTQDDYYAWSNFFARVDYEIVENKRRDKSDKHEFSGEQIVKISEKGDVKNPTTNEIAGLRFLGSGNVNAPEDKTGGDPSPDRLEQLATWISDPENDRFSTTQANRIWAQLMGQGIVDPIDDFRSTNPPSNPELLNALRDEFVSHNFSTRHLIRVIMNSTTYQLSSTPNTTNAHNNGTFARTELRRLTAEQTLDAIAQLLNVSAEFGGHKSGTKAVQLKGVRNGGFRYSKPEIGDQFLTLFGKPDRLQTCECERTNETTLAQTFEMVSGELISQLLATSGNRIDQCLATDQSDTDTINQLFWAALSRSPNAQEIDALVKHVNQQEDKRDAFEDIVWTLLNSNEFLLRR
ncbi:MAG: DUF1549 and DUF1553 domain-containing protein [Fuerstiella sp.]